MLSPPAINVGSSPNVNAELSHDPAIPLPRYGPRVIENRYKDKYTHPNVHSNTVHSSQKVERTSVSINR